MTTTNNTGLSAKEYARIQKLIQTHADAIEACGQALAFNMDVPAQRIINAACYQMGITRLDWEKIDAVRGDVLYRTPPRHIQERWARY